MVAAARRSTRQPARLTAAVCDVADRPPVRGGVLQPPVRRRQPAAQEALAGRVVLLRRDGRARARQPVHRPRPARLGAGRRRLLADVGLRRRVVRARHVAGLQPDLLARQLPRVPGPLEAAVAHRRSAASGRARVPGTTDSAGPDGRRRRVGTIADRHNRQSAEYRLPHRGGARPGEPGTDVSISRRDDALADQVRRPGHGRHLRRPHLRPEPGDSFLHA